MTLLEKMKDFFNLSHVVLEHSYAQKDVDKLNQVLTDMGAVPINVSGLASCGLEVSIYKLGQDTIKVELWEYEDIRLVGKKDLIEKIKAKMAENQ